MMTILRNRQKIKGVAKIVGMGRKASSALGDYTTNHRDMFNLL